MKDIFKAMGVTVANDRSLISSPNHQVRTGNSVTANQPVRKGMGTNASDALNEQLMQGQATGFQMRKAVAAPKNTHGEEHHSDIHESAKVLEECEEIKLDDKSLSQEELFLKAMSVLPAKPGAKVKKPPKDPEQVKQEKQQMRALGVKKGAFKEQNIFDESPIAQALDGLINFAPDSNDPELIAKVHENSDGVTEKRIERSLSPLDEMVDLIKGKKPKMDFDGDGKLDQHEKHHEKLDAKVAKKACGPKKSFVKSQGPGGLVFDFGNMTGNALADHATALLQQHADPIQEQNARYQQESYQKAVTDFTVKGEAKYMGETTPFGNISEQGAAMLNKPMDQQVKEAYEAGQFGGVQKSQAPGIEIKAPLDRSIPNIPDFQKSTTKVGNQQVQAQSPTDAAVIEMMKGYFEQTDTPGTITAGGPISVCAGGPVPMELEALKQ